jgi:hypothetical protein
MCAVERAALMPIMSVAKFERFFRASAGLDVDKADLKRYSDFVNLKIYDLLLRGQAAAKANDRLIIEPFDLLLRGQAAAKANGRPIIEPFDLPITKGLQERVHEFRKLEEGIAIEPILEHLTALPPLDLAYSEETQARLPEIAGGISVALAHTFKIIDPDVKNPASEEWERSQQIFDLLL